MGQRRVMFQCLRLVCFKHVWKKKLEGPGRWWLILNFPSLFFRVARSLSSLWSIWIDYNELSESGIGKKRNHSRIYRNCLDSGYSGQGNHPIIVIRNQINNQLMLLISYPFTKSSTIESSTFQAPARWDECAAWPKSLQEGLALRCG